MKKKLMLMAILILAGCGKNEAPSANGKGSFPIGVTVAKALRRPMRESLHVVGDIVAEEEVVLYSKVTGKLVNYEVQEGGPVKKEETVAHIDRDEVGFKYQKTPVASTISGTVGRNYLDPGADVRLDTPVSLIVNFDTVRIKVAVVEREVPKIKQGEKALVQVDAYPEKIFEGTVSKVSPVIDIATRTAPIEIAVPNPGHALKPGMFSRVDIIVGEFSNEVVIPEEAVVSLQGETFVYEVVNGKATRKKVSLGIRVPGKVQVKAGLQGEEVIVVAGHQKIGEGSEVMIQKEVNELSVSQEQIGKD